MGSEGRLGVAVDGRQLLLRAVAHLLLLVELVLDVVHVLVQLGAQLTLGSDGQRLELPCDTTRQECQHECAHPTTSMTRHVAHLQDICGATIHP